MFPSRLCPVLSLALTLTTVHCASGKSATEPDVERLVAPGQEQILRPTVTHPAITDLYVFGDSLSDTGRLKAATYGFFLPSQVYWRGRATNGPVWVDYVGGALNCRVHNYAMAGAATDSAGFPTSLVLTSLADQIDSYLDSPAADPSKTVMVIWIGPNNYLGRADPSVQDVAADIRRAAERLLKHGTHNLAIGTMPDLSGSLKSPDSGRKSDATLRRLTTEHNKAVHKLLEELKRAFPAQTIALFEAHKTNEATVLNPAAYGFSKLDEACYQGSYSGHFFGEERFCSDPFGVKLWDYLHPNSRMHCHYAVGFLRDLQSAGWLSEFAAKDASELCRHLPGGLAKE